MESSSQQSSTTIEDPDLTIIQSSPINVVLTDEADLLTHFELCPGKRHAIWSPEINDEWQVWWAQLLSSNRRRDDYKDFKWTKPKRSPAWSNFHQAVDINTGTPKVLCKICWKPYSHPDLPKAGSSTSTLLRHSGKSGCQVISKTRALMFLPEENQALEPRIPLNMLSFTNEGWRQQLVVAILSASLPFRVIENKELRTLLIMLRPGLQIPHRTFLRDQLKVHFGSVMSRLLNDLPASAKLSIALDAWQSPFKKSFLAITGYYITSDWQLRESLLGFEPLFGSHTGTEVAKIVVNVLDRFNVADRLFCITTDNASNNDTMRTELQEILEARAKNTAWTSEASKIPCMAHVIQLVVKAILGAISVRVDINPDDEGEDDGIEDIEQNGSVSAAIEKIRTLSKMANRSAKRTELLLRKQSELEAKRLLRLKNDIQIRWNSTYDMIVRAQKLREPINLWMQEQVELEPKMAQLRVTSAEWKKLRYLTVILRPFAQFTTLLGDSKDATINQTWNVYAFLFDHLELFRDQLARKSAGEGWLSEFIAGIDAGFAKLKIYYTKTGGPVEAQYALAAILDPSQKLGIFSGPEWGRVYVDNYTSIFLKRWRSDYSLANAETNKRPTEPRQAPKTLSAIFREPKRPSSSTSSLPPTTLDEAERYLQTPVSEDPETSVLCLWKHLEPTFPSIAKMARDYLAVPATGTGVERIFNIARDLHDYHRAQMNVDTIQQSMIVKHFHRHVWKLDNDWDNLDHVTGAPDLDVKLEQKEADFLETLAITDDEEAGNNKSTPQKRKRAQVIADDDDIDELSPDKERRVSQRHRRH